MKINEFFDKGFYINLDKRTDRKAEFEDEMKKIGLEDFFERVGAIDGTNDPDIIRKHHYCGTTYHVLFNRIKKMIDLKNFIIFEDDTQFINVLDDKDVLDVVDKALNELQNFPDWDLIYFGGHVEDKEVRQVSDHLIRVDQTLTTHAIGYNIKCIEALLHKYQPFIGGAIDTCFSGLNKYYIYPPVAIQRIGISDLDAGGKSFNVNFWRDQVGRIPKRLVQ